MLVMIEEPPPKLHRQNGGEGERRRRPGRKLGVGHGRELFSGLLVFADPPTNGTVTIAIVNPPGPVVPVVRDAAHPLPPRASPLGASHFDPP